MRNEGGIVGRVLNHRYLAAVGLASYSIYLWQQLFLNPGNGGFLCAFPLNLACALVAAIVSYCFIERPFLKWKGQRKREGGVAMSHPPSEE